MKPDAVIEVRFLTTSEGGRNSSLVGQFYACPLIIDNKGFDCRLLLKGQCLELGSLYEVPVTFLYRESALPMLSVGTEVLLWEGRVVAKGRVVKFVDES